MTNSQTDKKQMTQQVVNDGQITKASIAQKISSANGTDFVIL